MGDIGFDMLVKVRVTTIAFQREGFPLARERGFGDVVDEGITTFVWVCWYGMSNSSWEGGGLVIWGDMCMVGWEGRCMVGW